MKSVKCVLNIHPFPLNITLSVLYTIWFKRAWWSWSFSDWIDLLWKKSSIQKIWESTQNFKGKIYGIFLLIHLNNSNLKILWRSDGQFVNHPVSLRWIDMINRWIKLKVHVVKFFPLGMLRQKVAVVLPLVLFLLLFHVFSSCWICSDF